jgi:cell division protein FtsN
MEKFHQGRVETVNGEKKIYRVLLGPFSSKAQAREMAQKITDSGYEAVLMRNK